MKRIVGKKIFRSVFAVIGVILAAVFSCFVIFCAERLVFYPLKYKEEITFAAKESVLNSALVFAVVNVESKFNKDALSDKGASGLMQITEGTARYIAQKKGIEEYDIFNVETNLLLGCSYLKYLLCKFPEYKTALAAYNAGEGNVSGWLKDSDFSNDGKNLTNIPFKETKDYVDRVEKNFKKYVKIYSDTLDKSL